MLEMKSHTAEIMIVKVSKLGQYIFDREQLSKVLKEALLLLLFFFFLASNHEQKILHIEPKIVSKRIKFAPNRTRKLQKERKMFAVTPN